MSFKPNPKAQAENKFYELFGSRQDVVITGARTDPKGIYNVELSVGGKPFLRASNHDWRKAYKALKINVEAAFADGKLLPG